MVRRYVVSAILWTSLFTATLRAQAPGKVDFGRDVLPIFRQNCFGCHGSAQQMNGLRLDRRSSALMNGLRRVVPGSSENSFLYHRITGSEYGLQMPPTGPLGSDQVNTIKAWIDQGAEWPEALSNEADLPPTNSKALSLVEALRNGDRQTFMKSVADDPKLLNARGPEGSTPFMYAVLYTDAATLEQLLKKGANPNARNDVNATALMWAATDLEKTRVLVTHGADVNARSDNSRTPLMIAAGRPAGASIVKLLLDHGADPNPTKNPASDSSPLVQAVLAGDAESMQLLIDHGADVKAASTIALGISVLMKCSKCTDMLVAKNPEADAFIVALFQSLTATSNVDAIRLALDHGADVNMADPLGRTPLMYAATSDLLPADIVKLLIERGANVNAKSQHARSGDSGMSVLDMAKVHGSTPIVDLLVKAGAAGSGRTLPTLKLLAENDVRSAVQRSLPLLQRADAGFTSKSGCISCHNDSLEAMAVGLARRNGFRVDETIAAGQVKVNVGYIEHQRDSLHQGHFAAQAGAETFADVFGPDVLGYVLVGLDAERYKPDLDTDAVTIYLKSRQMPDGRWAYGVGDERPPLCSAYIGQTALAMRALQLYAPKIDKAGFEKSIQLAAAWLAKAETRTNEDRFWQLQGLAWAGKDKEAIRKSVRDVLGLQNSDGGWADLPSMESNAYATGHALVALQTAGVPVSDAAYQRGVQYLLKTQLGDGSWYVRTRAAGFQPYFDAGFPYGVDQFISAAGTSWATMALTLASQPAGSSRSAAPKLK